MRKPLLVALLLASPLVAACTENASGGDADAADARSIAVTSTDDACTVSTTEAPAGALTFEVTNSGSQVTEFYLLGQDGQRILGEVENIGPQLSRQLVVKVPAGSYTTACKPGMKGDGIRAAFTVTGSSDAPTASADDAQLIDAAQESYEAY
ncbi:MAG: cupredoxin domain-containing protein, partial [Gemmatimonadales bacterium]